MRILNAKRFLQGRLSASLLRCGAVAIWIGAAHTACAQGIFFVPLTGAGHWNNAQSWSPAHIPEAGETAYIHDGRMAFLYTAAPTIANMYVADFNNPKVQDDGTLNILDGATLRVSNQVFAAIGGDVGTHGVINQSGGSFRVDGALFMAFDPTHVADFNLSGGSLIVGNLWFRFGIGTMNQTGGNVSVQNLVLGEGGDESSRASYLLRGGTLDVSGTANIGKGIGSSTFNHSSGSLTISAGAATFNDMQFGTDSQDFVRILNDGVLNVRQSNYSPSEALADIAANRLRGQQLSVSTVQIGGLNYTSLASLAPSGDYNANGQVDAADYLLWKDRFGLPGGAAAFSQMVPEPAAGMLIAAAVGVLSSLVHRSRWMPCAMLPLVAALAFVDAPFAQAQVQLSELTDLEMSRSGADYYKVTAPATGQVLNHISPYIHQGNADVYPVDPRVTIPGDLRRIGIYWSQFLMAGYDPTDGKYFLTDWVESEGLKLEEFQVLQSDGKYVEYQTTFSFRDLFTSTSHQWIWVDGDNRYQRVQTTLEVHSPIKDVGAIWTELFNTPDAFETVVTQTRGDGLQSRNILGATNRHYLMQYELGRDDWIAFVDPRNDQAASVARALLSSKSDIRAADEVTPIWADATLFDNIELHVHRSDSPGETVVDLAPGTSFFMDNLLVTNPAATNTDWINAAVERGHEWMDLIGPPVAAPAAAPPPGGNRTFSPATATANWSATSSWNSGSVPQLYDSASIGARRTAVLDSQADTISSLNIGGTTIAGTLEVRPGADLLVKSRINIGAGSGAVRGTVVQTGGSMGMSGDNPILFMAYDEDDTANYSISAGRLFASTIWFRFGQGTMNQSGGTVGALQLVLGEGGGPDSQASYNLSSGVLAVLEAAHIGKGPGTGDAFDNSNGVLNISGGTAVFGDLLFGNDATDAILLSGTGTLFVRQDNFSIAEALADISRGNILGDSLNVSQVHVDNLQYIRIATSAAPIGPVTFAHIWDLSAERTSAIPEPSAILLASWLFAGATAACRRKQAPPPASKNGDLYSINGDAGGLQNHSNRNRFVLCGGGWDESRLETFLRV